jgi:type IV fimbrial biogenesis protein FimT
MGTRINKNRAGGFTLMELMFTIAVAGILAAVAVPSFRTMMASNRLVTQANEIVGAVQFARSQAITRNGAMTLCRTDAEDDDECAGSSDEWEFVLRRGALPSHSGTMLFGSDLATDEVVFGADGFARVAGVPANNEFTLCSTVLTDNNMRTITLGAGSCVSTQKSTGSC